METWLSVHVGFAEVHGTGWLRPVRRHADWPLGILTVQPEGIAVGFWPFSMGFEPLHVPWSEILGMRPRWTGFTLECDCAGKRFDLDISGLFLWDRFQTCLREHAVSIPEHAGSEK